MDVIFFVISGINDFINKMIIVFDLVGFLFVYKYVIIYVTIGSFFNLVIVFGNLNVV